MIDTGLVVREAYMSALDGNIVVDSANIPVYDMVPDDESYPYVVLWNQEESGGDVLTRTKDNKNASELFVTLRIVTGFQNGIKHGGKKLADQIAAEVLSLLLGGTYLTFDGLENVSQVLDSTTYEQTRTDSHIIIVKEIVINHLLSQS